MNATFLVQLVLNGLSFGALLFLMASGFTLIFGLMRISNLAHGAFYVVGAYVAVVTVAATGNFWAGLVAGGAVAAAVGLLVERGLLRRVRNREMPEVLITVGVLFVLTDVVLAIFGGDARSVNAASGAPSGALVVGDFAYPQYRLFIIGVTVVIGLLLFALQRYTRIGAIVRAGVDDREMTSAMGIDIDRVFTYVFVFGAVLAGAAGAIGSGLLSLTPFSGTEILLFAMVVVIIGGLGSVGGAAVGAILIGLIDTVAKVYVPELSYFTIFAPMALVLVLRPQGLFGRTA
ncbi:branched-chain amino acid ABC transporter permease [Actinobacteria bacterium YIM 96077]|uniref:Branched-chain amino acid ABC transporter permease n=1 Tax=Phytoactinopolyspora halophila TaxID=1981511 RepID=A0A329QZ66_9ACTN|nr:branched-chain amino acid ABC transporter permease [Phytoactinopolyspora halophila]AYY13342.1 branched-chain amino acid ABC transporter permease [Actinobacteria bacterium YIM 96077]RAW17423.1 branched-chain amino acid ABC transporter permease [Phytoactinopolyspora halophila]